MFLLCFGLSVLCKELDLVGYVLILNRAVPLWLKKDKVI